MSGWGFSDSKPRSRCFSSVKGLWVDCVIEMGFCRTSAARAGSNLWRIVRFCKDVSTTCNSSGPTFSSEPGPLFGNYHLSRHIHHVRWIGTGSVTMGEEELQSCSSFCQDSTKPAKHNFSSGMKNLISGRQFARQISSQVSKRRGQDGDVKVKEGDVDLKDDDDGDVFQIAGDSDPAIASPSDKSNEGNSDIQVLWGKLENCSYKGQTMAQLELYISSELTFTKEDSIFLISKLKRYGRYLQAAEIADYIVETKIFPWTAYDQVVRISLKGKLGSSTEVENIFNSSPPELQTEIAYNAVIKHFCDRGMVKKAKEWVDRLTKAGLMTHAFAFNRLLVLYKDKSQGEKVNEVLAAMDAVGVSKDIYTYNIWMAIKGKQNDLAGVEEIFAQCKADPNVKLDPSTYATVAGTYINLGLTEKAAAALEEGERMGFERAGNADQVMATLWGKLGNKEKVLNLWSIMKQKQIVPARTYVVMIETFGRLGMVDQAEILFNEMQETKGKIRPRQFTALLGAYAKNDMLEKVDSLIGRIDALELKRSATINHHIVHGYLKMGKVDKALAVLSEAKWKSGFPLWFTTMVLLLGGVAENGDVTQAEKIFDTIKTTYNQKNRHLYNLLLKSYARAGLSADGFLLRMAGDRILPNKETHEWLQLCSTDISTGVPGSESKSATVAQAK